MATKKAPAKPTSKSAKTVIPARSKATKSATKEKPPGKPGRKAWEPDLHKIEQWAMQGLLEKEIAALSGITHQVFSQKKNEIPELIPALARGRAKGTQVASSKLFELMLKGDRASIQFYLERKSGWKPTAVNANIDLNAISSMSMKELEELEERLGI